MPYHHPVCRWFPARRNQPFFVFDFIIPNETHIINLKFYPVFINFFNSYCSLRDQ